MSTMQDINDQHDLHDRPYRRKDDGARATAMVYLVTLCALGMVAFGLAG